MTTLAQEVLFNISQEVTTIFTEDLTTTVGSDFDISEQGTDIPPTTTTSTTMTTMAPIYQANGASRQGSISTALLSRFGYRPSNDATMDLNNEDDDFGDYDYDAEAVTSGAQAGSDTDLLSTALIIAGSYFALKGVNKVVRSLYRTACFKSDPRLVADGHRDDSSSTRGWAWAAYILERAWVPLWYTGQQLRDDAVNEALDFIEKSQKIKEQLKEQRRLLRESGNVDDKDYIDPDLANDDWHEAYLRQLQAHR